jgi:hypothetical protein
VGSSTTLGTSSTGFGEFMLTSVSTIELDHYVSNGVAGGTATASGEVESYAQLILQKVA